MPKGVVRLIPFVSILLLGAGCFASNAPSSPEPVAEDLGDRFGQALASEAEAVVATGTEGLIAERERWDNDRIFSKRIRFEPPEGYWVYLSGAERRYWLVEGEAPEPGGEDPGPLALEHRVAALQPVTWDTRGFKTWEEFVSTMAQLSCLEGSTDEDLVGCNEDELRVVTGTTIGNYPYRKFSLQAVRRVDRASRGMRTYITVRLSDTSLDGVFATALTDEGVGPLLELVKSMRPSED